MTHTRISIDDLSRCIANVQQQRSRIELVYKSHPRWPLPPMQATKVAYSSDLSGKSLYHPVETNSENESGYSSQPMPKPLKISVLDSSFNPLTLAHFALASSFLPISTQGQEGAQNNAYDARLLLLSVRNVDKALKPGDATYEQRLEMMMLLAEELEVVAANTTNTNTNTNNPGNDASGLRNVAVGIIDEPTFVKKSSTLRSALQNQLSSLLTSTPNRGSDSDNSNPMPYSEPQSFNPAKIGLGIGINHPEIQLHFLMGTDTLERLLAPRYYVPSSSTNVDATLAMHTALRSFFSLPPEGGDGSIVVCAGRDPSSFPSSTPATTTTNTATAVTTATSLLSASSTLDPAMHKRQNTDTIEDPEKIPFAEAYIASGVMKFIDLPSFEKSLSSSEVRKRRIERDDTWTSMVPSSICDYIKEKGLYL
ncbi:Nucleotidylyl transferase [Pyrrhoderma noxium]|uniref:Nucleotidylyl transferase n=1 Tax=Pyrrhoderma noxium TaxID=2282107 RepID=A0A286U9F9_9AGAM|nr:Nucleotidylyl transferase [Pyrrhoderma noxium]